MYLNVSEEQSVNGGLMLTTTCASSSFRLGKWIFKHMKGRTSSAEADSLLTNALSAYRGGYCDGEPAELKELVRDLAGTQDARLDGNFIFLGNKSDLSYFWKRADKKNSVIMLRSYIDQIPDDKLRTSVISTMTKAQLDGVVAFDGRSYALTDKGKKAIFNTDFALGRLRNECQHLGIAKTVLDAQYDNVQNDRIDKRLSELGLDGKFDNCDRVTANKAKLLARNNGSNMSFFVPGTSRMTTVDIPSDHVIELDDKTLAVFLERGKDISATVNGEAVSVPEGEIFKAFENKNKGATPDQIACAVENAEKEALAEEGVCMGSFDEDVFMGTAERRGNALAKIGKEYTVFLPNGEAAPYTVSGAWLDVDGNEHYHLMSADGAHGDLLLPQDAINCVAFENANDGRSFIQAHSDMAQEYDRFFSLQGENAETVSELEYRVKQGSYTKTEDGYTIPARGNKHVNVNVPSSQASVNENGELIVALKGSDPVKVSTGAYQTTVSAEGAGKMLGKSAEVIKNASAAADAAARASTSTASVGMQTAASVIPPVEGISASAKIVMQAAATVTSGVSQTASVAQKI